MNLVIQEIKIDPNPLARPIADHIESFTDYDFAHLLFSDGTVKNSISLEKQLNIIQVADLVLPDAETSFEEYTTMELLSVAMRSEERRVGRECRCMKKDDG